MKRLGLSLSNVESFAAFCARLGYAPTKPIDRSEVLRMVKPGHRAIIVTKRRNAVVRGVVTGITEQIHSEFHKPKRKS